MDVNKLKSLQKELDEVKYKMSEEAQRDLCGELPYCKLCKKRNKYPCATAFIKHHDYEK